jgi:hypothetical protein
MHYRQRRVAADKTDGYVIPMARNGHNLPGKMGRPTKYTEELVLKFCRATH